MIAIRLLARYAISIDIHRSAFVDMIREFMYDVDEEVLGRMRMRTC